MIGDNDMIPPFNIDHQGHYLVDPGLNLDYQLTKGLCCLLDHRERDDSQGNVLGHVLCHSLSNNNMGHITS